MRKIVLILFISCMLLVSCTTEKQATVYTKQPTTIARKTCPLSSFQTGVYLPEWSNSAYGTTDKQWQEQLPIMQKQTSTCWVGMPLLFSQQTLYSTTITAHSSLSALSQGIAYAHSLGLHVYLTTLLDVQDGTETWSGAIKLDPLVQHNWFASYWQAIAPYARLAQATGVEQFAFGVEEQWLQRNASSVFWNSLITHIRSVYHGSLVYDINWTSLEDVQPAWMHNPALSMVGVSAYLPQETSNAKLDAQQIRALWQQETIPSLDAFARQIGKPLFLSEIGYRDTSDAFFAPWKQTSNAAIDQNEQALAYNIALQYLIHDPNIKGVFAWGWMNVQEMSLAGTKAVKTIQEVYSHE